jgi:hypothetical protein
VPGLGSKDASEVADILQDRLNALSDLAVTLKHVHWNVVGPNFIAVHTMLDPQVDAVRLMVDDTAERIATLGGSPVGTPGALVAGRTWDDYSLGRDDALAHRGALDLGLMCAAQPECPWSSGGFATRAATTRRMTGSIAATSSAEDTSTGSSTMPPPPRRPVSASGTTRRCSLRHPPLRAGPPG